MAFYRADAASASDTEALMSFVVERFGKLDCVVNNAGAGGEGGPIAETSVEGFDRTIALLFSELHKFGLMNVRFLIFRRRVVTVGTKG